MKKQQRPRRITTMSRHRSGWRAQAVFSSQDLRSSTFQAFPPVLSGRPGEKTKLACDSSSIIINFAGARSLRRHKNFNIALSMDPVSEASGLQPEMVQKRG